MPPPAFHPVAIFITLMCFTRALANYVRHNNSRGANVPGDLEGRQFTLPGWPSFASSCHLERGTIPLLCV